MTDTDLITRLAGGAATYLAQTFCAEPNDVYSVYIDNYKNKPTPCVSIHTHNKHASYSILYADIVCYDKYAEATVYLLGFLTAAIKLTYAKCSYINPVCKNGYWIGRLMLKAFNDVQVRTKSLGGIYNTGIALPDAIKPVYNMLHSAILRDIKSTQEDIARNVRNPLRIIQIQDSLELMPVANSFGVLDLKYSVVCSYTYNNTNIPCCICYSFQGGVIFDGTSISKLDLNVYDTQKVIIHIPDATNKRYVLDKEAVAHQLEPCLINYFNNGGFVQC